MYLPPPLEFHKPSFIGVLVSWRVAPFQHEAKSTPFLELRVGKNASSVRVCMQFGDLICYNRLLLLPSAHSFRDLPTYAIWIFSFSFQVET